MLNSENKISSGSHFFMVNCNLHADPLNTQGEGDDADLQAVRYDFPQDFSTETALIFGELYRH